MGASFLRLARRAPATGGALCGLGNGSTSPLAPGLQRTEHRELRGIVTGSPEKPPVWQQHYAIPDGNVYSYDTLPDIANNDAIDVVHIVTPPSRSRAVCDQSRPRRRARLVRETDGDGCRGVQSLVDAARGNGVQLPIGYRLQHAPNNRTVMRYAEGETYGAVERIETGAGYNGAHPDPHDCRRGAELGSGALCGMGIYPINTARYATGMPSSHRNFRAASWRRKRAASAGRRTTWTSLAPTSGTDCATVEL